MLIHCPDCQEEMTVDPLSMWNTSNCIQKCVLRNRSTQFSLAALLTLFVPFALVTWAMGLIGWELTLSVAGYFSLVFGVTSLVHNLESIRNRIWDTFLDEEAEPD